MNELEKYTTEELRAELKRRYEAKKLADAMKPRCRNCKHLMNMGDGYMQGLRCEVRTFVMKGRIWNYSVTPSGSCDKYESK